MPSRNRFLLLRHALLSALGLTSFACGSVTTDGGQGGAPSVADCEGAMPVLLANGTDSGYVRCNDGTIHRAAAVACEPTINAPACAGTEMTLYCTTDADCTGGLHGKCVHYDADFSNPTPSCGCVYTCANDSECGEGKVCVCPGIVTSGTWPVCAFVSTCQTDSDCASGQCGITSFNDGCGDRVGLACRSTSDTCRVNADCEAGASCVVSPWAETPGIFTCEAPSCVIGRPLLVAGAAVTAQPCARTDWLDGEIIPMTQSLEPHVRQALAEAWTDIAALEHASVASFARVTLQLMALGAPADLLFETQSAAADEIAHARIAYALASAYANRSLGPGNLDLSAMPIETDRNAVIVALIEEACVGETVGVAEALTLADLVQDPALRAVHLRLAKDEERHAQLAWKTLQFLLASGDESTYRLARTTFERAIEETAISPTLKRTVFAEEHGLLSSAQIGNIRRQALADVVRPLAHAMLDRSSLTTTNNVVPMERTQAIEA